MRFIHRLDKDLPKEPITEQDRNNVYNKLYDVPDYNERMKEISLVEHDAKRMGYRTTNLLKSKTD